MSILEAQRVAIELQAGIGVTNNDRSVIYAKKQPIRWLHVETSDRCCANQP